MMHKEKDANERDGGDKAARLLGELVGEKKRYLQDPMNFVFRVVAFATSFSPNDHNVYNGLSFKEIIFETIKNLTGLMSEKELSALQLGLGRMEKEQIVTLPSDSLERKQFKNILNYIGVCLQAKRISVLPNEDDGDMLG